MLRSFQPPRIGWYDEKLAFGLPTGRIHAFPPEWFGSLSHAQSIPECDWWEISDFDSSIGDIKLVWEASRFDWVLSCAQNYLLGQSAARSRLEAWLEDWCSRNPPYKGPNWKCGQEASIRVMHLGMAALILSETSQAQPGLLELIRVHLLRIAPTIQYAIAQDNNHGTSEAAALFIGGSMLALNGDCDGLRWENAGRKWLEDRVARLIGQDGSFSQYSLNYHRVALDTLSMVEIWRSEHSIRPFSPTFYSKLASATNWIRYMILAESGDGPKMLVQMMVHAYYH